MPRLLMLLVLTALAVPIVARAAGQNTSDKSSSADQRVFELRTYYTNEGKLDDLHKRFREHTNRIFKKHGIEIVGFWTPQDKENGKGEKLIYLIAFPSREAAKKSWDEFKNDAEWQRVFSESHKNGVLVKKVDSVFLDPTDYSPIK
jgi:hypothetical protein